MLCRESSCFKTSDFFSQSVETFFYISYGADPDPSPNTDPLSCWIRIHIIGLIMRQVAHGPVPRAAGGV